MIPCNRLSLSFTLNIECTVCGYKVGDKNSPNIESKGSEINLRLAYAVLCIGKGEEAARNLCGFMNSETLLQATKEVCLGSMID